MSGNPTWPAVQPGLDSGSFWPDLMGFENFLKIFSWLRGGQKCSPSFSSSTSETRKSNDSCLLKENFKGFVQPFRITRFFHTLPKFLWFPYAHSCMITFNLLGLFILRLRQKVLCSNISTFANDVFSLFCLLILNIRESPILVMIDYLVSQSNCEYIYENLDFWFWMFWVFDTQWCYNGK